MGNPDPAQVKHVIRRTPEPYDADGNAALHAVDERLFEEIREPLSRAGAVLLLIQLGP